MNHKMSEDTYLALVHEMVGLCDACGEERDNTEPDAEHYPCDACGEHEVFGVEQLLIKGQVEFTDD